MVRLKLTCGLVRPLVPAVTSSSFALKATMTTQSSIGWSKTSWFRAETQLALVKAVKAPMENLLWMNFIRDLPSRTEESSRWPTKVNGTKMALSSSWRWLRRVNGLRKSTQSLAKFRERRFTTWSKSASLRLINRLTDRFVILYPWSREQSSLKVFLTTSYLEPSSDLNCNRKQSPKRLKRQASKR